MKNKKPLLIIGILALLLLVLCPLAIVIALKMLPSGDGMGVIPWGSVDANNTKVDGIDVSHHNGKIDWAAVGSNKRIKFVYVKATEGATWRDKRFASNVSDARSAGIHVGAYHFFSSKSSPEAQFENFRAYTSGNDLDLIPVIDVEWQGMKGIDKSTICDKVMRIATLMEKHYGRKPMIYTSEDIYDNYLYPEASTYYLWISNLSRRPILKGNACADIWQFSERGYVDGAPTHIDLDRFVNGMTIDKLLMGK